MAKMTEIQQEALAALKEDILEPALAKGWTASSTKKGVNASFAYVTLAHELEEGQLQVFLAVDPDKTENKFIYGSQIITGAQAFEVLHNPGMMEGDEGYVPWSPPVDDEFDDVQPPVPPTSAAHGEVVPPMDTSSAAHGDTVVPPTANSAAHQDFDKPQHLRDHVEEAQPEDVYNQTDVLGIGDDLAESGDRIWSAYSTMTNEELLLAVDGKELIWNNAFAKRRESATVTSAKRAGKHPAKITGFVTVGGNDTRILHFLADGAGFRSLAIGRLVRIS